MDVALYTSEKYDLKHENMSKSRKKSVKKSLFDENNDPPDTGTDMLVYTVKIFHIRTLLCLCVSLLFVCSLTAYPMG